MLIDVRREQVLDAALRLLNRGGYAAVTMEAVSREVELAKPLVYAAYPDVEPLLLALLERERERAITTLTDAMPANPDSWRPLLMPAGDAPPQVRDGDRRHGLPDLDLDLTAISLLAMGEQGARMALCQPEQFTPFTPQRFVRFIRSLLDMISPPHR